MLLILLILFFNLLSVTSGSFIGRNKAYDLEKNWLKKLNGKILPTEVLYRSPDPDFILYQVSKGVESGDYDVSHQSISYTVLSNWSRPTVLMVTDPDEQTIPLLFEMENEDESDDDNQITELFEYATMTRNNSRSDGEQKKGQESSNEVEHQANVTRTSEELNTTEVYEEPFVRVYVKPLCNGPIC